jgi:hypothetical protein
MGTNKQGRRQFAVSSLLGLGGLSFSPILAANEKKPKADLGKNTEKKLNVVCVGAHPGDPEFGCGGTMAKYSKAGHQVIFLYLSRGEAYDTRQSFERSAKLRSSEAEVSCRI